MIKILKKHVQQNENVNSFTIEDDAYWHNLPDGLNKGVVNKVHDYDNRYLASALRYADKEFDTSGQEYGYITVKSPTVTMQMMTRDGQVTDTLSTTQISDKSPLGKALLHITSAASTTKTKRRAKSKKKTRA